MLQTVITDYIIYSFFDLENAKDVFKRMTKTKNLLLKICKEKGNETFSKVMENPDRFTLLISSLMTTYKNYLGRDINLSKVVREIFIEGKLDALDLIPKSVRKRVDKELESK